MGRRDPAGGERTGPLEQGEGLAVVKPEGALAGEERVASGSWRHLGLESHIPGDSGEVERLARMVREHLRDVLDAFGGLLLDPPGCAEVAPGPLSSRDLGVRDVTHEGMPEGVFALAFHRAGRCRPNQLVPRQLAEHSVRHGWVAARPSPTAAPAQNPCRSQPRPGGLASGRLRACRGARRSMPAATREEALAPRHPGHRALRAGRGRSASARTPPRTAGSRPPARPGVAASRPAGQPGSGGCRRGGAVSSSESGPREIRACVREARGPGGVTVVELGSGGANDEERYLGRRGGEAARGR